MAAFPILARGPDDSGTGSLSAAAPVADLPPDAQIILPVRNFVLFPGVVLAVAVDRPRSIAAAQQAVREGRQVGVLMQRDADVANPSAGRPAPRRDGRERPALRQRAGWRASCHLPGEQRFRVTDFVKSNRSSPPALSGSTSPTCWHARRSRRASSICKRPGARSAELLPQVPQELVAAVQRRHRRGARRSRGRLPRHRAGQKAGDSRDDRRGRADG